MKSTRLMLITMINGWRNWIWGFSTLCVICLFHFIPKWKDLDEIIWLFSFSIKKLQLQEVLLALFSISFTFWRILTKLCGITHVASKTHILIIKGEINKIWAFFSPLGASWHYNTFHSNLEESERNFVELLM